MRKLYSCPRCNKTGGKPRLFYFQGISYIICSNSCRDQVMAQYS